jgi:hypothetical protein
MIPRRRTIAASAVVGAAHATAPLVARSHLPRLLFFGLTLCLALAACNLLPKTLNPPEWIQGYWLCPYTDLNDGRMAYHFSDSAFEIGTKRDDGFDSVERYTELNSDSYEQSSSTQYVLHIVEHPGTTWGITRDWTFTRLSETQLELGWEVLTRF